MYHVTWPEAGIIVAVVVTFFLAKAIVSGILEARREEKNKQ